MCLLFFTSNQPMIRGQRRDYKPDAPRGITYSNMFNCRSVHPKLARYMDAANSRR